MGGKYTAGYDMVIDIVNWCVTGSKKVCFGDSININSLSLLLFIEITSKLR